MRLASLVLAGVLAVAGVVKAQDVWVFPSPPEPVEPRHRATVSNVFNTLAASVVEVSGRETFDDQPGWQTFVLQPVATSGVRGLCEVQMIEASRLPDSASDRDRARLQGRIRFSTQYRVVGELGDAASNDDFHLPTARQCAQFRGGSGFFPVSYANADIPEGWAVRHSVELLLQAIADVRAGTPTYGFQCQADETDCTLHFLTLRPERLRWINRGNLAGCGPYPPLAPARRCTQFTIGLSDDRRGPALNVFIASDLVEERYDPPLSTGVIARTVERIHAVRVADHFEGH